MMKRKGKWKGKGLVGWLWRSNVFFDLSLAPFSRRSKVCPVLLWFFLLLLACKAPLFLLTPPQKNESRGYKNEVFRFTI